ncbi:MAG: DUF4166 domain-containing protein [Rhodobacteraceae bacterium]|nr:DUF4166 domain-containing protein [Paracoccaceae bacterium]
MKILILGGYGTFGGRLVELLADLDGIEILVAGRSLTKAQVYCDGFRGAASVTPLALDRADIAEALDRLAPDALVDASGPFQAYGSDPYAVVRACIAAGVAYFDLADSAAFVAGIDQFDEAAKAANIPVLSGVSSFPVLTTAVVTEIAREMEVRAIFAGIAPSPHAGVGLNVLRAVLGYAGAPVTHLEGGGLTTSVGLGTTRRAAICVPGHLPLPTSRFSIVDVPDHQVIPALMPEVSDIWMGAAPTPGYLHRMLNLLALARARFGLPSLAPLAPVCHWVLNTLAHGPHRGGMLVRVAGMRDGAPASANWALQAEGDSGPLIPSMAVAALLRHMVSGKIRPAGARAATQDLSLADYDPLFKAHGIATGFRRDWPATKNLYRRVLGDAFDKMPPALQALHSVTRKHIWSGRAEVTRGRNPLARFIAGRIGFPKAGKDVPVTVTLIADGAGGERWHRNFDGADFRSHQSGGRTINSTLIVECFGPVRVSLAAVIDGDRLRIIPQHWSLWAMPLPRFLLPGGETFEDVDDQGRFRFNVTIAAPLIGLIVAYRGWLVEEYAGKDKAR